MDAFRRSACITIIAALCAGLLPPRARAQTVYSAEGPGHPIWAGAEYSNISASFPFQSGQRLQGVGVFADIHLNYHFGLVGDARFLTSGGFQGSTESSYLAGPKVYFIRYGNIHPYGKLLAGMGRIHYPYAIGDANYFALAPGAGIDYRLRRRWMLQFEYEYQLWLDSPGFANVPDHKLTPNGFHLGVAYRVF